MSGRVAATLAFLFLPAIASAQIPVTSEFQVNQVTSGPQRYPSVAGDTAGNFLVVWESGDLDVEVFGRLYDSNGNAKGPEFPLGLDSPSSPQRRPDFAFDTAGNFLAVWTSDSSVLGRRFDPAGNPLSGEFVISSGPLPVRARASAGADGGYIVVWQSFSLASNYDIVGQRLDAAGNPLGPGFQINTFTAGRQEYPAVASDARGNFVVAWQSDLQEGSAYEGIFARRFDAAGGPRGGEFHVNTTTSGWQWTPTVAMEPGGAFTVVWPSIEPPGEGDIRARRYDPQGTPLGGELPVNTFTASYQRWPAVALDASANLLATWESDLQDGSSHGVAARQFDCDGQAVGSDFIVNTYTYARQEVPRIATSGGHFMVAWESVSQDGSQEGIFARVYRGEPACSRRYYTITPCRLADTRHPPGPAGGPPLGANTARSFPVASSCGIPADARAVSLNVTAVNPTDAGDLRVYPSGETEPLASALNFVAGRTRANSAQMRLGLSGMVEVRCVMAPGSTGQTDLVLDAYGYYR